MLKALELAGFKSFADKTRFDFPDGITVVVGPNGSGKSNIVDAMKWVLGSQSAKSLRGKDMSDVIFKGSQTRGPSGSAEVTIVFDNPDGALPVDAPEVRVTRRVYRSGEGEYLINGGAVRLKDVRNLIRGTGIGIDAYSLIEQGKVDKMLNAGAKDRRVIFEEAAGISRFKAKKVEAERRLARVQTNLTRLGDIVDEVGARLKSLRSQASKAERYRQATDQMRQLRTTLGWTDWTSLAAELDALDRQHAEAVAQRDAAQRQRESLAERRQAADRSIAEIAEQSAEVERRRIEITTSIATIDGRRHADLESAAEQSDSLGRQRLGLRTLMAAGRRHQSATAAATEIAAEATERLKSATDRCRQIDQTKQDVASELQKLRDRRDTLSQSVIATARQLAESETAQVRASSRLAESKRAMATLSGRRAAAEKRIQSTAAARDKVAERLRQLDDQIEQLSRKLEIASSEVGQTRRHSERRREEVSSLQSRRQGVVERHRVLEDLQQRQEGLSVGVRDVINRIESQSGGNKSMTGSMTGSVVGLVADCFEVDVEIAPLVDAALGHHSQYIVARGDTLQKRILDQSLEIHSRVGILRIDELPPRRAGDRIRLDGLKGVMGRADRMVRCTDEHEPIVRHLLSATWLVDSIATALGLRKLSGAGLRFVTAAGELLENDGSVVIGPHAVSTGLVSRRSELTAAAKEIEHYEFQIAQSTAELDRLRSQLDDQTAAQGRLQDQHRSAVTDRAGVAAEVKHAAAAVEAAAAGVKEIDREIDDVTAERQSASEQLKRSKSGIVQLGQKNESLQSELAELDATMSDVTESLSAIGSDWQIANAELATATQSHQSAIESQRRADQAAIDGQEQWSAATDRFDRDQRKLRSVRRRILAAEDRLAELIGDDERTAATLGELADRTEAVKNENREVIQASERAMTQANQGESAVHAVEAKRENAKMRRETLASRLMEDYEIDLHGEEVPEDFEPIEDRMAAEAEIQSLRSQLQKTTSVNMEALEELQELQTRYDTLHGQYQDLTAAKDSLQRMIGRINADSRRLFMDTLEAIRVNFQQLYRKSFGGGHADLVLEESDDPLEAGVEIVATPPGKPSFNNSLLSGGEKALTAVALLMSIFKYRPSPFCVLDEVDAPFDEANIGRFVTVLSEFLDHSKFVVVTHSKKTMTAATTLYGVTMQESGVSKQVSIRFEDVSDDGEIAA